jgi:hypothetical protein
VLIPVDEGVQPDTRTSVLALAVRRLRFEGDDTTYIDLSCPERDLFPEFDDVIADVLDAAAESQRPGAAAVRAVDRWRRLFRSRLVRGLSYQAKLGLFAELTVLKALVDEQASFDVDTWRGPLREPHDFEAPSVCLEVKAVPADGDTVTVHGLAQLDTHDDRPLDLIVVSVLDDPDGVTLTELVRELTDRVASPTLLRSRLASAGWPGPPDATDSDTFTVAELRRVPITDDVPRLASGHLLTGRLSDGVDDLRYAVAVSALLPFASDISLDLIAREAFR